MISGLINFMVEIIASPSEKKRSCFLNADKSKTVNCVPASATALHTEAPINANNNYPNNQSRFCCQDYFFTSGLQFQANSSPPPANLPGAGFIL